jgi:succinyl-CoA synthetase beta subunit
MKIHEYQAKSILAGFGVKVPRGEVARSPEEAGRIAERLGGKVVVKAQIHAGGRGRGGGIKVAADAAETASLAETILGMNLITHQTGPEGRKVRVVLIEEAAEIEKELYLGMVVDRSSERPVMMASTEGGMEIEEVAARTPEKILKEWIDPGAEEDRLRPRPGPVTGGEGDQVHEGALRRLPGDRCHPCRDQSSHPHEERRAGGARRQDELRRQRSLPPSGLGGAA